MVLGMEGSGKREGGIGEGAGGCVWDGKGQIELLDPLIL